jgi:hypothetical protein
MTQEEMNEMNESMQRDIDSLKEQWGTDANVLSNLEQTIAYAKEKDPVYMPDQIGIKIDYDIDDEEAHNCIIYDTESILCLIKYLTHGPITKFNSMPGSSTVH